MRLLALTAGASGLLLQRNTTKHHDGQENFFTHVLRMQSELVKVARTHSGTALEMFKRARANVLAADRDAPPVKCGNPAKFSVPHAKPKEFNAGSSDVVAGDVVEFRCEQGYTTDGSNDKTKDIFDVECKDMGYYEAKGSCVKASKCGQVPEIQNARPTGETDGDSVEYACVDGFSLDAEEPVPGGLDKNRVFFVECQSTGVYEKFTGKCQAYKFVSGAETQRVYNTLVKALYKVECENTLAHAKKDLDEFPAGLDSVCSKVENSAACESEVADLKTEFDKDKEEFDPKTFCDNMWENVLKRTED
mmetsp:Transcript_49909/g.108977  ORF Transcript_49909/g.108977 Transcript_49909/m.108977 type:complete len:305 (+) Transcript_49909:50-964(+)